MPDINDLSDADLLHLAGGSAQPAPSGAAAASAGPVDINSMSDAQLQKFAGVAQPMGTGEAAGRLLYKHGTFGLSPGASREKEEQAAREHPFLDVGTGAAAMLGQTAALGPLAAYGKAAQGAGMLARGARGAGTALEYTMLPNMEANTALTAARTGAKLAGNYSALEAAGHGLTSDQTLGQTAKDVGTSYGLGTVGGGLLGAGAHGVSRVIGAGINRFAPESREVLEAIRAPETQGARDVLRAAGLDNYTHADLQALRNELEKGILQEQLAGQPSRYADLNLIEALEAGKLKPTPGTGELKPDVRVSPNLRDLAQDWANTGGAGRQTAVDRFANRQNEMSAKLQGDIDRAAAGNQSAPHPSELANSIDQIFRSGAQETEAAQAAQAARKIALDKRFERFRTEKPAIMTGELGELYNSSPIFRRAVENAAQIRAVARSMEAVKAGDAPVGAQAMTPWITGQPTQGGGTLQIFSPGDLFNIHHDLYLASKPRVGADPSEIMRAQQVKRAFSGWVDRNLKGTKDLNNDYRLFKQAMEAGEHGGNLSMTGTGPKDVEALNFLNRAGSDLNLAARDTAKHTQAYDQAMQRYQSGARKSPATEQYTRVRNAEAAHTAQQDVIDSYRRSVGEAWKSELQSSTNPDAIVRKLATPAGRQRILQVLGDREGNAFYDQVLAMEARRQGLAAPLNISGNHEANVLFQRLGRENRNVPLQAFRAARAEKIKAELEKASAVSAAGTNSVINKLLSQGGKQHLLDVFGPDQGRQLIEALYNKQAQSGLSKTLFGGPDTAYKMARNRKMDSLMDAVHGVMHLRPMQAVRALGEMGSAAYKQRRADQGNMLLSQQGPESLTRILDAILAQNQLRTSGMPYFRNPALRGLGAVGTELPANQRDAARRP